MPRKESARRNDGKVRCHYDRSALNYLRLLQLRGEGER